MIKISNFETNVIGNLVFCSEDSAHQRKSANFVSKFDLAWHDIHYSVRDGKLPCGLGSCRCRKMLLQSVTGVARGGEVMALMGPSGSGKTTLLNILSDTISSQAYSGHVYVNGQKRKSAVSRNMGNTGNFKGHRRKFSFANPFFGLIISKNN